MADRKLLSSDVDFENKWLKVLSNKFLTDGINKEYTMIKRSNSVIVIPLTPTNKTLLLSQYRYPINKISNEFPMGGIDDGENEVDAVSREFFEETGLRSNTISKIGSFYPVPGLMDQIAHVYIAKVEDEDLINVSSQDNTDDIDGQKIVSIQELFYLIRDHKVTDGFTLGASLFLKLYIENYDDN